MLTPCPDNLTALVDNYLAAVLYFNILPVLRPDTTSSIKWIFARRILYDSHKYKYKYKIQI